MNFSPSTQAEDRLSSMCLPVIKPFLDAATQTVLRVGLQQFHLLETKLQKGHISPNTSCRLKCSFSSYSILKLKLFGPDAEVCPGMHTGVTPRTSGGSLLLHVHTSSSANRTLGGWKFTWLSFILMSQYRVAAHSHPPRVWLCFKNPK